MLVQPNWGAFAAKFNDREQSAFEWLCSLLFSKEHKQPIGPLRYLNQAGIEEDPITVGNEVIGWQAKFISGRLSDQKATLEKAIDDAKQQNPSLTRICIYTNADFTPSSKPGEKEPRYKAELESHAKSKGVDVTWRTRNFFEKPFVCEENANISKYFFSNEKSTIDLIQELTRHTEAILNVIRSEIVANRSIIKIDRAPLVARLNETLSKSPVVIVSGEAGVGKTAIAKDFHAQLNGAAPLLMFKATEFTSLTNANQLFREYGDFTVSELTKEFNEIGEKYIVIDSAEELSGLERPDVFQEFLSTFRLAGWKILFTTRLGYLEDLERTLVNVYGVAFEPLIVEGLTSQQLASFSEDDKFALPENDRLRHLLQNPFYLNEYLREYPQGQSKIDYSEFREAMWNTRIAKTSDKRNNTHRKREQCFLEIARRRATTGSFFVTIDGSDDVLPQLEADEIIKFDANTGGYFVAHDIYAEWALDKIIEREFSSSTSFDAFYAAIGSALPIRRAFRSWLSEKLLADDQNGKRLIESTVGSPAVERHWKDEVIVAALLSPYSEVFIGHLSAKLLTPAEATQPKEDAQVSAPGLVPGKREDHLLAKLLFMLRIACKGIDQEILRTFGTDAHALQLFAEPRGSGWGSVIHFISGHKDEFGLRYMRLILPVLDDWNRYNRKGATTKDAAQIALFYYSELTKEDGRFPYGIKEGTKEQLIRTIFNGSAEVKGELKAAFDSVIIQKDISRDGPYHTLVEAALSDLAVAGVVAQQLPTEILALANLFWFYTPPEGNEWYHRRSDLEIEQYFDLAGNHSDYYPASAYQTPIHALLLAAPRETIDFIVDFTNRSIGYFAKTDFAKHEVDEVEIRFDPSQASIRQYICHRIWNMYRGTQVAPNLLESIHMALESWLLAHAKGAKAQVLEQWCLYLLKKSHSASITALVTSAVLAQPSKLFNVAKVLFRTKELFFFDAARLQLDMSAKSTYAISHDPTGIFTKERLSTCEDSHRKRSLEHLALHYQLFAHEGEDEVAVENRQKEVWRILDDYYSQLLDEQSETDADRTWRLCLARMDRRKMNITTETTKDNQVLISFNPEIDPELKKYSEDALAKHSEAMKYIPLKLWAHYRFERNEGEYKKYPQYENDPQRVIEESKIIFDQLETDDSEEKEFALFYKAVPAYACSVLLRDYFEQLASDQKALCKEIILAYASHPLSDGYQYQISDGVGASIQALPFLMKPFPGEAGKVKELLLSALFDEHMVGVGQPFSDNAVSAILDLWRDHPADANSLFLGYISLQPRLDAISDAILARNRKRRVFHVSSAEVRQTFIEKHKNELDALRANRLTYDQTPAINTLTERVMVKGFSLLPTHTKHENHRHFVGGVCEVLAKKLLERDREERFDYTLRHKFFEKLAEFVLTSNRNDIQAYLQPFVDHFKDSREAEDFFSAFVTAEDRLHQYDQFWFVWDLFYPSLKKLCERESARSYSGGVIHTYLLAWPWWRKGAREWRSLKVREKAFFRKVAEEIGGHPAVLYSLSKFLNEIGSHFTEDGIAWISGIVERTPDLPSRELEVNTIYYLETLMRNYILANRHRARTTPQIRHQVLSILNFLLEKGSATAYLLREDILG